ncbi:MAG: hypothetical protein Ct9H300mP25_12500 [Acidobacteriota bacterium]|nr:MAG: hypothetical protein Ct9H300mP25_12500 [Acidobacteriota bacterium]
MGRLRQSHTHRNADDGERSPPSPVVSVTTVLGAFGRARLERDRRREPVLPGVSIGHNEYGAWG